MITLTRFIHVSLGLIFVIAGFVKIDDPQGFAVAVANYQLLPESLVWAASQVLAWLELICGLALVFGVFTRGAALVITVLMVIFLAAMGYNISRGLDVSCGCFSTNPDDSVLSATTLIRDVLLLLASAFALVGPSSKPRKHQRRR